MRAQSARVDYWVDTSVQNCGTAHSPECIHLVQVDLQQEHHHGAIFRGELHLGRSVDSHRINYADHWLIPTYTILRRSIYVRPNPLPCAPPPLSFKEVGVSCVRSPGHNLNSHPLY